MQFSRTPNSISNGPALVRAPIAGRISDRRVDAGNLITGGSGATLLTNIISVDPISFTFEASEADYLRYSRLTQNGNRPGGRESADPVRVRLADETEWKREGQMEFVDNQLNAEIRHDPRPRKPSRTGSVPDAGHLQQQPRLFGGEVDALLVPDAVIVSDQTSKIDARGGEGSRSSRSR